MNQSLLPSIVPVRQTAELFAPLTVPHSFARFHPAPATAATATATYLPAGSAKLNLSPRASMLSPQQPCLAPTFAVALKLLFL